MRVLKFTVPNDNQIDGKSVFNFLKTDCLVSRKILTQAKQKEGNLLLNGEFIRTIDKVKIGDEIQITVEDKTEIEPFYIKCEDIEILLKKSGVKILYNDIDVAVAFKPFNMPTHPSKYHQNDTLANVFADICRKSNDEVSFKAINRLDKDTTGLVVIAKNRFVASVLAGNFQKKYVGITKGEMPEEQGIINEKIDREDEFSHKRCVKETGQSAITEYKIIQKKNEYNLIEFNLKTGRTHQIRVHMSYIGFPLIGDEFYGGDMSVLKTQALQCLSISFIHPVTKKKIIINDTLCDELKKLGF